MELKTTNHCSEKSGWEGKSLSQKTCPVHQQSFKAFG
jgi:glycosidase